MRLKRMAIDTSHWCHSPGFFYTDEALAQAVAESVSYADVLRRLGVRLAGGSHAYLARRIRAAELDTTHFLGQAHRHGQPSPRRTLPEHVLRVLPPGSFRIKTPQLRRALIATGVSESCAACGCGPEWKGQSLRLIIDHVNGDWHDNRQENRRFLCPNCHAQTATWCLRLSARSTIEEQARLAE